MTEHTCNFCHEPITGNKKYCNLSCAGKMRKGVKTQVMVDFTCPTCTETTSIAESDARVRTYCSKSCSATATNPKKVSRRKVTTCRGCGDDTYNASFCSVTCSGSSLADRTLNKFLEGTSKTLIKSKKIYQYLLDRQQGGCAICNMPPIWNGKTLVFIHDHIDGNSENNSPDNIRLVCSNCDSQLDTYKSKNVGKGRHSRRMRYAEGKSS